MQAVSFLNPGSVLLTTQAEALIISLYIFSVRSHMLNVDVATMFNPETEEILRKSVEDCEKCTTKVTALTTKGNI